jgi:Ser-tRNA(Ala) deacylase AlaX
MTEALYFLDCYLKEFEATVEKLTDGKGHAKFRSQIVELVPKAA